MKGIHRDTRFEVYSYVYPSFKVKKLLFLRKFYCELPGAWSAKISMRYSNEFQLKEEQFANYQGVNDGNWVEVNKILFPNHYTLGFDLCGYKEVSFTEGLINNQEIEMLSTTPICPKYDNYYPRTEYPLWRFGWGHINNGSVIYGFGYYSISENLIIKSNVTKINELITKLSDDEATFLFKIWNEIEIDLSDVLLNISPEQLKSYLSTLKSLGESFSTKLFSTLKIVAKEVFISFIHRFLTEMDFHICSNVARAFSSDSKAFSGALNRLISLDNIEQQSYLLKLLSRADGEHLVQLLEDQPIKKIWFFNTNSQWTEQIEVLSALLSESKIDSSAKMSELIFFSGFPVRSEDHFQLELLSPILCDSSGRLFDALLVNADGQKIAKCDVHLLSHTTTTGFDYVRNKNTLDSSKDNYRYALTCEPSDMISIEDFLRLTNVKFSLVVITTNGVIRLEDVKVKFFSTHDTKKTKFSLQLNDNAWKMSSQFKPEHFENRPQSRHYAWPLKNGEADYSLINTESIVLRFSSGLIKDSAIVAVRSIASNNTPSTEKSRLERFKKSESLSDSRVIDLLPSGTELLFGNEAMEWIKQDEKSRDKVWQDMSTWFIDLTETIELRDPNGNVAVVEKGKIVAFYIDSLLENVQNQLKLRNLVLDLIVNGKRYSSVRNLLQAYLPHITFGKGGSSSSSLEQVSEEEGMSISQIESELQSWWNTAIDANTDKLRAMHNLVFYEGLDIRPEDLVHLDTPGIDLDVRMPVVLVHRKDNPGHDEDAAGLIAVFQSIPDDEAYHRVFLKAKREHMLTDVLLNRETRHDFYLLAHANGKWWRAKVGDVKVYQPRIMKATTLCMDFGTSYSTCGMFSLELDGAPNSKVSALHEANPHRYAHIEVKDRSHNILKFAEQPRSFLRNETSVMAPTVIAVKDCSGETPVLLFGYDAERWAATYEFRTNVTIFRGIKRWIHKIDSPDQLRLKDIQGRVLQMTRFDLLRAYLLYIIGEAEQQFKCRFSHIHLTSPVKLKQYFLDAFSSMLNKPTEEGRTFTLEKENALDEGVSVLFNDIIAYGDTFKKSLKGSDIVSSSTRKAMIIDSGGGTTDVAACSYRFDADPDIGFDLHVETEFMNGDSNFGGNNLTYLLMQLAKIKLARACIPTFAENMNRELGVDKLSNLQLCETLIVAKKNLYRDVDEKRDLYTAINRWYEVAENIIPTRYGNYHDSADYDIVRSNFSFLWAMSESIKKEFFRQGNITNLGFFETRPNVIVQDLTEHIPLRIRLEGKTNLVAISEVWDVEESGGDDLSFSIRELEWLYRGAIYDRMNVFLNDLYETDRLKEFASIRLTGQSTKIGLFDESLKEFLPGKKIVFNRSNESYRDMSEYLKLACLVGVLDYQQLKSGASSWKLHIESKPIVVPYHLKRKPPTSDLYEVVIPKERLALKSEALKSQRELKPDVHGFYYHRARIETVQKMVLEYRLEDSFGNEREFIVDFKNQPTGEVVSHDEFVRIMSECHFPFVPEYQIVESMAREDVAHIFIAWNELYWGVSFLVLYREAGRIVFYRPIIERFENDQDFFDGLK